MLKIHFPSSTLKFLSPGQQYIFTVLITSMMLNNLQFLDVNSVLFEYSMIKGLMVSMPHFLQSEGALPRLPKRKRRWMRSSGLSGRWCLWRTLKMFPWERWVHLKYMAIHRTWKCLNVVVSWNFKSCRCLSLHYYPNYQSCVPGLSMCVFMSWHLFHNLLPSYYVPGA